MKNKVVLIVDDNALNRRVFENILMHNYSFESAGDGLEAIEKLKSGNYDLVLMDIQMPRLDGISALKQIREDNLTESPIIAVSAYSNQADREYFLSTGFDDFIAKPVKPKDLLETIHFHLEYHDKNEVLADSTSMDNGTLDETVILQLLKFNSLENIRSVYVDFLEEAENLLSGIKKSLILKNFDDIGGKLHIIKGNSGTLGINDVFRVSASFESDIKEARYENAEGHCATLEKSIDVFKEKLLNQKLFEKYE
ncbi:sensory box histidine kinase/response regulator [Lunatimonas lonarensis]|uniref:Sensory box histidine kinase/response regulator n=1 Tax=Lunatimonas lonarensis TaxID=1232681 RepID=R7ZPP9_9BACT|nr:response regulator [Lunatimonas lonarensis]EON76070.1 sensory box histidine kinase/response regulator [Lunatimonas lonarensis]